MKTCPLERPAVSRYRESRSSTCWVADGTTGFGPDFVSLRFWIFDFGFSIGACGSSKVVRHQHGRPLSDRNWARSIVEYEAGEGRSHLANAQPADSLSASTHSYRVVAPASSAAAPGRRT